MTYYIFTLILALIGFSFLHYHDKLKTQTGRLDVLRELQTKSLTRTYIRYLCITIKWIRSLTGSPFSLRSLGVSVTIAQAYQVIAVLVSVLAGGSGVLGELGAFRLNTDNSETFLRELGLMFLILVMLVVAFFNYRKRFINKRADSDAVTFKSMLRGRIFLACMAGILVGKFAGFYVIIVPAFIAIFVLRYLTKLDAIIAMAFASPAVIATIFGLESSARYGTPAITIGESLWVSAPSGMLGGALAVFLSTFLGPYLNGYRAATWVGTGIASVALLYIVGRQIVIGGVTQAMGVVLVFWTVLPLVNALNDYVSLGISHSILLRIVALRKKWNSITGYGILDLLTAVFLMCLSALTIPLALAILDLLTGLDLNVKSFVIDSASNLYGQGLWLGLMILTTLTWTVVHLGIVLVAISVRLYDDLAPKQVIKLIQAGKDSNLVKLFLSARWIPAVVVLVASVFFLIRIPVIGSNFVHYLEMLALYGVDMLAKLFVR